MYDLYNKKESNLSKLALYVGIISSILGIALSIIDLSEKKSIWKYISSLLNHPHTVYYTVNLASFINEEQAKLKVKELKKNGINDTFIWNTNIPGKGKMFRVSTGLFPTMKGAKLYAESLRIETFVVKLPMRF